VGVGVGVGVGVDVGERRCVGVGVGVGLDVGVCVNVLLYVCAHVHACMPVFVRLRAIHVTGRDIYPGDCVVAYTHIHVQTHTNNVF
jgi:hypothetical protein